MGRVDVFGHAQQLVDLPLLAAGQAVDPDLPPGIQGDAFDVGHFKYIVQLRQRLRQRKAPHLWQKGAGKMEQRAEGIVVPCGSDPAGGHLAPGKVQRHAAAGKGVPPGKIDVGPKADAADAAVRHQGIQGVVGGCFGAEHAKAPRVHRAVVAQ